MPATAIKRATKVRPDDPLILARVVEATRKGHPIQTASALAGLSHTTAWEWMRDGTALLDANPEKSPEELGSKAVWANEIKSAQAEMVDKQLDRIDIAAAEPKHWPAAMTLLERRFPNDFGRNQRITTESVSINVNVTAELTEAQTTELLAALAERSGQPRTLPSVDSPQLEHLLPEATEQT